MAPRAKEARTKPMFILWLHHIHACYTGQRERSACKTHPAGKMMRHNVPPPSNTPPSSRASKFSPYTQSNIMPTDIRQAENCFVVDKGSYPPTKGRGESHADIGIVSVRAIGRETNRLTLRIVHELRRQDPTIVLEL